MWDNILTSNIKGVLLDLDDTLYEYKPCHEKALESWIQQVVKDLDISSEKAKSAYAEAKAWTNLQLHGLASSHSRLLYSQFVSEKHGFNAHNILTWEKAYWDTFIKNMTPFPKVISFLEECQNRGIKLCLVSDMTTEIQFRKLIQLGIDSFFNYIVTSEESGQEKPFAKPFLLALHKLDLKASEVIMVGDSETKDIQGARSLGITSYLPFFC